MYGSARLQGRHTSVVSPPQLAFGTSLSVHDPLYTGSLLVAPPKGHLAEPCIQLRGVVLHSRLLRLTHILGCVELSQFVQRFLTRLVMAHPGRPNSQHSQRNPDLFGCLGYHGSWSPVATTSVMLREPMLELGDDPAAIGHPRCRRVTMAMQNLAEGIVFKYRTRNCFLPVPSSLGTEMVRSVVWG
ncbi:hypothetical protein V8E52_009234 [Russula decolorans]